MNFNIAHHLDSQLNTLVLPIAGKELFQRVLPALNSEFSFDANLLQNDFKGELGEVQFLYDKHLRIILLGLGEKPDLAATVRAFRLFVFKNRQKLPAQLAISFLFNNEVPEFGIFVEAMMNGIVLGTYQIGRFKTAENDLHPLASADARVDLIVEPEFMLQVETAAKWGVSLAQTQMSVFDLVNAPSNKKLPASLGEWALASGLKYGYKVRVFDKQQITQLGLNALLAVNRGSEFPPVFIVMEYNGLGETTPEGKTICLVGKGVTFDTGGLSLKPSSNMHLMKSDMGGAAAVLGTLEIIAKLKLPVRVIGIVPATDNSIGTNAIKPSDVIGSYSGKTIEVIDTDAEGRLILADGLAYALKNFQPDVLIDLATLTGSTVRTFGYHAAGLFSNSDQLAEKLQEIGEKTGERLWRLPVWDVYKDELKSDVADIKNFSGKPVAGAISAAKFLQFFIEDHSNWAHLDIAGVAFGDSEFSTQKSATGFGIRLLLEYIRVEMEQHISIS